MNIETNHATLAGHTVEHELDYAGSQGFLGSVDANTGDLLLGWDTDQFPTDVYLTTKIMLVILKYGGFTTGGLNFDAKVRRESFEPIDLFYAHVGGMDAFAKGLKIAAAIRADGELARMLKDRYARGTRGVGGEIEAGKQDFAALEKYMLGKGDITPNAEAAIFSSPTSGSFSATTRRHRRTWAVSWSGACYAVRLSTRHTVGACRSRVRRVRSGFCDSAFLGSARRQIAHGNGEGRNRPGWRLCGLRGGDRDSDHPSRSRRADRGQRLERQPLGNVHHRNESDRPADGYVPAPHSPGQSA